MDKKERARLREINEIAKNQLSHTADLPPIKQLMVAGKRFYVQEFPMDPALINSVFPSPGHKSFLPPAERTYVKGRDFTIE